MLRARRSPLLALFLFVAALLPDTTLAQITPPAPGVSVPESYRKRVAQDRTAFQFRRAWFGETERVRKNREIIALAESGKGLAPPPDLQVIVSGVRNVPVLAGKYSNTGADPYTVAQLQAQLFDGPNATGTMTQYYDAISYGAIDLVGTVYGAVGGGLIPVTGTDTYYEGNPGDNGLGGAAQTGQYLKALLDSRDATVNFAIYDNDGPDGAPNSGDDDGFVDFVAFVHPENGGECGNNNMWSHRWVYEGWWGAPYTTDDAKNGGGFIQVSDYTIQPLVACGGLSIIQIGVYAHEFGHAFGLPDLYDTDALNGGSAGIGQWCLMASGSYGGDGNHSETPVHMSAWCKEQLGWITPTVVCADQSTSLPAVSTTPTVLKVYPHGIAGPEYFLIENRVQAGFDQWLPASGIAVFHVDNLQSGNADENRKLVDLEEADGFADLDNQVNRGDGGDVFPGTSNNQLFDDASNPNARDYAGANTSFSLSNFGAGANPRSFDVTGTECRLRVADVVVNDLPDGNNNGVLDGQEIANLQVGLVDDFSGTVTGVSATLTSLTAGVTVTGGNNAYGTVGGTVIYGTPEFTVQSTGSLADGTLVRFFLSVTGDGGYSSSDTLRLYAGTFVLLVEDDAGAVNTNYFTNAISGAGWTWVHHDVSTSGLPAPGLLNSSAAVVWYTGETFENTVSADEQVLLTSYLNGGGKLFLSGQDIGYDLEEQGNAADRDFYADVLHADYILDHSGDQTLDGVTGDPIGNAVSLSLDGAGGAHNSTYPSQIAALGGATDVFRYSLFSTGGIRYDGAYRLVYFAFNFESVSLAATRITVVQRILSWLTPGDQIPPTATLSSPVGGEVLDACGTHTITWTAGDDVAVTGVDLYYSGDGGATYPFTLATGLANTGAYLWSPGGILGTGFRVKLVARDAAALQAVSRSASDFTFADPDTPGVVVIAPNGGETYPVSSPVPITWTVDPSCVGFDSSQVYLSMDGGNGWSLIATVPAPDTSFVWAAPDSAVDSLIVWVETWSGANAGYDLSDGLFAVVDASPPTVSLLAPDGGEIYGTGNAVAIAWADSDDVGVVSVDLFYSSTGAAPWTTIGLALPPSSPYGWTAAATPTTTGRVRVVVRDAGGNTAQDSSGGTFTLVDDDPPSVAVVTPNGGESYLSTATVNIQATTSDNGAVDSVCVEFSLDAGATWTGILCGPPSFPVSWPVPDTTSDSCLIRVTAWDPLDNQTVDESDSLFTIQSALGVADELAGVTRPVLLSAFPNPLRGPRSTFAFYLPAEDRVTLTVYDLSGRVIRVLAEGAQGAGYHEMSWDGTDEIGRSVGHGVYFYSLQTSVGRQVRKLVKIR